MHWQAARNKTLSANYASYSASKISSLYSQDHDSGKTKLPDDGDNSCLQESFSFIGLSFCYIPKWKLLLLSTLQSVPH
jgi:hypothetical protein